ncbi:3'-5' exonuclease [Bdellovibrionales bacterium]|nr:3'-5' exonuclease [Bdellovibrionales bacterium]
MVYIGFDLETTGFISGIDQIVEIGAVKYIDGEVDAVFSTLIDPGKPMPEGASKVNGITDDMLIGKPKIDEVLTPFAEFCGDDILVAHNAIFDYQFLIADINKYESKAPTGVILDTFGIAKKILPGLPNYKLGTLVQHLGIEASEFHRAEVDASYCAQLFGKMMQKISNNNQLPPIENLISLTGKAELLFPQITPQPKQLDFLDSLL